MQAFLLAFAADGIVPEQVRLFEGQEIPPLAPYDFLFVLGGSQDTWQEDQFPWLVAEKQAIREWVTHDSARTELARAACTRPLPTWRGAAEILRAATERPR